MAVATRQRPTRCASRRLATRSYAAVEIPSTYSKVKPLGERIFIKVAAAEEKTQGGILLPDDAQRKPTSGSCVSAGPDAKEISSGTTVLYSRFGIGATDMEFNGEDHVLLKESDILGSFPFEAEATASDISSLQPLADRVLLRVQDPESVTAGGVLLPDSAKEAPVVGEVVRVGRGKEDEEGNLTPVSLNVNDKVIYFKYAGDKMTDDTGTEYVVIPEQDILGKC